MKITWCFASSLKPGYRGTEKIPNKAINDLLDGSHIELIRRDRGRRGGGGSNLI